MKVTVNSQRIINTPDGMVIHSVTMESDIEEEITDVTELQCRANDAVIFGMGDYLTSEEQERGNVDEDEDEEEEEDE